MTKRASRPLTSIAIFGQSHDIWPVSALLSHELPNDITLTVIEDATRPKKQGGLNLPLENEFHSRLNLAPFDLLQSCKGTFGLGSDFRDWRGIGSRFYAANSGNLPRINGIALHHIMLRAALLSTAPEKFSEIYEPFRFAARASHSNKFACPSDNSDSPDTMLGPTLHLARQDYIERLAALAKAKPIEVIQARSATLMLQEGTETIQSIRLDTGDVITADLYIDVSGELSKLYPSNQKSEFRSHLKFLPFDRIATTKFEKSDKQEPHRIARAVPEGVQIETPLRHGRVCDVIFSSDAVSASNKTNFLEKEFEVIPFSPGYIKQPWTRNFLRMGNAASSFGPLMCGDMRLLQHEALYLAKFLPSQIGMVAETIAYNKKQQSFVRQLSDFCLLPFVLNNRQEVLWRGIREQKNPESLRLCLEQFSLRGRFNAAEHGIFDEQLWIDMMIGFGVLPNRFDPLTEAIDMRAAFSTLKTLDQAFSTTIKAMQSPSSYLESFLKSEK